PVADLVAEYFEDELLRGTIAARGVFGTFLGPWSAGSSLVLLLRAAGDPHPAGSTVFVQGGSGALTEAMALPHKQPGQRSERAPKSAKFGSRKVLRRGLCW